MKKIILFLTLINFSYAWSFKEADFNRFLAKDCDNNSCTCCNLDLNIHTLTEEQKKRGLTEEYVKQQIQAMHGQNQPYTGVSNMLLSNYQGITLDGSDFSGLDLSGFSFSGSRLRNVNFSNTKLINTHFDNAIASGAKFYNANIDLTENFANFANTQLGATNNPNAPAASFKNTKIKNASFQGARLDGVTFGGAEIDKIDLSYAILSNADFSKVKGKFDITYVSGVTNPATIFSCTKMPYGYCSKLNNVDCKNVRNDYAIVSNKTNDTGTIPIDSCKID